MLPLTCLDWYAAAGGDELRMFPWGSMDPGTASQYAMYDCYYPTGMGGNCASLANIAKVGFGVGVRCARAP